MGWLQKTPLVSLLFAVAIATVPFLLGDPSPGDRARFDDAREAARDYFVQNPVLEVGALGELVLDTNWLAEARAAAEAEVDSSADVRLPPRLLARSQARLDGLVDDAYLARRVADPSWRLGVLDLQTPGRNYVAHAFVHELGAAVALCVIVLLLAGIPLERAWGSPVFALFVLTAIPLTAQAYRVLDGSSGVPWSGSAGLAGALVGAYFIRSLGGHLPLPGWVLLPAWIAADSLIVRGFWIDDPGAVPWATLAAAVALGAGTAGALRLLRIGARVDAITSNRSSGGPNPAVTRAARMCSDGDPYQAFDLIQAAWREDTSDLGVCEAFFSIAVEVGQPEAAAEAVLPPLRCALRKGEFNHALDYWLPLATRQCKVSLEPTAFVRLGETLLDAGHPEEALFSLRSAIDAGVSAAGAARIVNIARDLDPVLTRTAAHLALADPSIEGSLREEFERLVATKVPAPSPAASPEPPPESRSPLDRRVQAEHQTVETTAFPLELDTEAAPNAFPLELDTEAAPNAFSLELDTDFETTAFADPSGDLNRSVEEESLFALDDLEAPAAGFDFASTRAGADDVDPRDDETDTDFTPVIDAMPSASFSEDVAFASLAGEAPTKILTLRSLKAVDAVPVGASDEWIEIDAAGRGKSKLPLHRIEAIAIGAVDGLGPRPVLVLDFVLNWFGDTSEPLKSIRLRSDRFDPLAFSPGGGNPLEALTRWIGALESATGAACLPTRDVLAGRFGRFADLAAYERDVLMAEAPA
ncbi:MAG: hypothetical protein ACPGVZ_05725 [Myxococcota bacterium]